jgi:CubicO group peptidase (beta-lactamase class C family)
MAVAGPVDVSALMRASGVPGLSLAYLKDSSAGPTAEAWGVASKADNRPVTPATVFRAGSLSKPVTAFAALRLARKGHLDVDADVNSLLKSWQIPLVGGWRPAVSVRMLLAHVAGTSGWGDERGYGDGGPPESLIDVLEGRGDTPPLTFHTLPNVMWHYSSGGYHLLQLLVTDVTGASFEKAVRELVLDPLEMSSTTFESPLPQRFRAVAADGHIDGRVIAAGTTRDPAVAAQGMFTTPSDLMRLARAINAKTAPEMLVGHPVEPRMGLGLFLNQETGRNWWSHSGSVPGFECLMGGVAEAGFAWAALANSSTARHSPSACDEMNGDSAHITPLPNYAAQPCAESPFRQRCPGCSAVPAVVVGADTEHLRSAQSGGRNRFWAQMGGEVTRLSWRKCQNRKILLGRVLSAFHLSKTLIVRMNVSRPTVRPPV